MTRPTAGGKLDPKSEMPRTLPIPILVALLLAVAARAAQAPRFTELGRDLAPLKERFNRDVGHVRLLTLISPTCSVCLGGAVQVQQKILQQIPSANLNVYAVWTPITRVDGPDRLPKAMSLVPDPRAVHFWDNASELSREFSYILGLHGELADSVYFVYLPGAKWGAHPPKPDYVMHRQLEGVPMGHLFDADKLCLEVRNRVQAMTH